MDRSLPRVTLALALAGLATAACASGTRASASGHLPASAPEGQGVGEGPRHTEADVHFISGMIAHHAQAILIAGWAEAHDASPTVRTLCERIIVSQRDEIDFMRTWLEERGEPVPPEDPRGLVMPGMDEPMPMPGMLTPAQLSRLDGASGPEFDRLFLTLMIQHHRGAIAMVDELLATAGAAQDGDVFRFAADVHADQGAEIDRMSRLLATRSPATPSP